MKKLSKSQIEDRDHRYKATTEFHEELQAAVEAGNGDMEEARATLEKAIEDYNDALQTTLDSLAEPLSDYNGALNDLREFAQEIASDIQSYVDERSDRWQEGERGEAYRSWQGEWESYDYDLEEVEIEMPDRAELPPLGEFVLPEIVSDPADLEEEVG